MHLFLSLVAAAPKLTAVSTVSLHPAEVGNSMLITLALLSLFIGVFCNALLVRAHMRFAKFRASAKAEQEAAAADISFRDALLAAANNCFVALPTETNPVFGAKEASAYLQSCMEGHDAIKLTNAMESLRYCGQPFDTLARTVDLKAVSVRGEIVGGREVLFFSSQGDAAPEIDYRAVLDAVPVPVWVRGPDLNLRWCNRAFLDATGSRRIQDAVGSNATLELSEFELAATARDGAANVAARRYALVGEKRRALSLSLAPLANACVAGIALDVTDAVQAEAALRLSNDAALDLLDGLPVAVAIFGRDQRLENANGVYAQMWDVPRAWLETRPCMGEILDRLRENRGLAEQPDYQAWKREQIGRFESRGAQEEFWHLPDGRSLRVVSRPHLLGGIYMIFTDISVQLGLEASFKLLTQVHRATLDTVDEGIAVFGPDGRLVLHNSMFADLWRLREDEIASQPHFTRVAGLAEARFGKDGIWSIVSAGLTSADPERWCEWGRAVRSDGRILSLTMVRLPNGATVVTFTDLTDLERFEQIEAGGPDVAARSA